MFLGAYEFDGDTDEMLAAYARLMAGFPPGASDLHVCVVRDGGITIFDACPSREVFAEFSGSPGFAGAVAAAGLPAPQVEPLGDVHAAHLTKDVLA